MAAVLGKLRDDNEASLVAEIIDYKTHVAYVGNVALSGHVLCLDMHQSTCAANHASTPYQTHVINDMSKQCF